MLDDPTRNQLARDASQWAETSRSDNQPLETKPETQLYHRGVTYAPMWRFRLLGGSSPRIFPFEQTEGCQLYKGKDDFDCLPNTVQLQSIGPHGRHALHSTRGPLERVKCRNVLYKATVPPM